MLQGESALQDELLNGEKEETQTAFREMKTYARDRRISREKHTEYCNIGDIATDIRMLARERFFYIEIRIEIDTFSEKFQVKGEAKSCVNKRRNVKLVEED